MVLRAFLAALAYFICYGGNWLFAQSMTERPIVVGFITGLFLGDIKTGIIVGAAVEAIFMGSVNIGGNISAEPAAAATFAVGKYQRGRGAGFIRSGRRFFSLPFHDYQQCFI